MDKFIADAVYLFTKSSTHCKWRLDHAYQLIVHPAKAGRAKIVYRNGRPRCFYSYMLMSPEVEESYLKHNRMFMFPCYSLHEVSAVKFKKLPKEMGFGRYTITHFWYSA